MNYTLRRGVLWLAVFTVLALLPLWIARVGGAPEPRTFAIEFGVALGFLALSLMALQFLFSGRIERIAPGFGMDNIIQYHREVGIVAFVFVLAHPIILIAADSTFLEYFDPRVNFLRAVFLTFATLAVTAILATSFWRETFRLQYEWWRLIHGTLALGVVFVGVAHAVQVGHYLDPLWKKGALALLIGGLGYLLLHTRLVRPWLARKRPYRVVRVEAERDSTYSLTVEPVDHPGMRFTPGQFAWITINDTPFTLQQHPFSFCSSARKRQITFAAKESGDFTSSWKDIDPGAPVFLEGPFGAFTPAPSPSTGLFLIMGGIGVTPAMSILRTMRDDAEKRPVTLIYGNKDWETIAFRDELEELREALQLRLVHLLEEPADDWDGERGFVTEELLQKLLPDRPETYQYLICGPKPLMDVAETSLRDLGIAWDRIYTERFQIV